jgi:DMSO/TMAO reductase YedYZ molybdopterin-dependent catalytic subunit
MRASFALRVVLLVVCAYAYANEPAPAQSTGIDVGGEIVRHEHLSREDIAKLPHVKVHASAHGVEGDFDGVPLIEILRAAGAPTGEALRGPALALYVRITAADGYRAVFALGELDPSTGNRGAILADAKDGKPLDDKDGPLRVIVPGDRRPARWVRQVIAIDLLRAPDSKSQ